MEFKMSFIEEVEKEINEAIDDNDILFNMDKLGRLEKLLSIYNSINSIITQRQQVEMFRQSQDMMKNIDFSKIDMNNVLGKLVGK